MLNIERFVFSPFYENTYLIWDNDSKETAVLDPGCNDEDERKIVDEYISSNQLSFKYLINTHCHIDHIFGNSYLKKKYSPIFLAPEKDVFMLDLMIETASKYNVKLDKSPLPDKYIDEDEQIMLGNIKGEFIFTPGHSPGEYCLYFKNEKVCFTGDVLFKGSIGRTDLWGGNLPTLLNSIRNKLFTLPADVRIYPGHDLTSSIADEIKYNEFMK